MEMGDHLQFCWELRFASGLEVDVLSGCYPMEDGELELHLHHGMDYPAWQLIVDCDGGITFDEAVMAARLTIGNLQDGEVGLNYHDLPF